MKFLNLFIVLFSLTLLSTACTSTTNTSDETGSLTVVMTDAPFPIDLVAEANVTINKIEIRKDSTEDENENPFTVLSEETQSFNLLELQNGVKASLADLEVETGSYDLIRLYVSEASVVLKDGTIHDLFVPSGEQTGIKIFINPSISVESNVLTELLLDFDVAKSFVVKGNMNTPAGIKGFNFKPTLRAVNTSTSGRLEGVATDTSSAALANVQVSAIQDSTIGNAFTDSTGSYAIIGLKEGLYNLQATKAGYDTLTVTGVEVKAGSATTTDFELTPVDDQ